jgi:hypothetical protein
VDYLLATFRLSTDRDTWVDFRGAETPELELWGINDLGAVQLAGEGAPKDVQVRLHAWGPLGAVQMQLESDDVSLTQDQLASLLGLGTDIGDPRSQGGFSRILGKVPAGLLSAWARKTGWVDEVGLRLPVVEGAIAGPTPEAGENGQVAVQAVPTAGVSGTAKSESLVELTMGKYLGQKLFVGVDTEVMQHTDPLGRNSVDPQVGGVVEYQLPNKSRLSVQHDVDSAGVNENKVMLEGSARFDNYNPHRRRWDLAESPTTTPGPSATPSPTLTPTPAPTPASAPTPIPPTPNP